MKKSATAFLLTIVLLLQPFTEGTLAGAEGTTALPSTWPTLLASLSIKDGQIIEARGADKAKAADNFWSDRTLVIIEDDPSNSKAQSHIASLVESLIDRSSVPLVAVEAAEGDLSMTFLKKLSPPGRRRTIGSMMVKKSQLSGAELGHLVSTNDSILEGTDNAQMFNRSAVLYLRAMGARKQARHHLKEMSLVIALFLHKDGLLPEPTRLKIQQAALSLAELTQMLGSEPSTLSADNGQKFMNLYRSASRSVNQSIHELGMGDTEIYFADPVFDQILRLDAAFAETCKLRDVEAARRTLESMDSTKAKNAVWILRPSRIPAVLEELRRLGVPYLRLRPTKSSSNPARYRKELVRSFGPKSKSKAEFDSNGELFLEGSLNPLRNLPLMAQAMLDLERRRAPRLAVLAAALGPELGARVQSMLGVFRGAALEAPRVVNPMNLAGAGRGNPQLSIESMNIAPSLLEQAESGTGTVWTGSIDEENSERYLAFKEQMAAMNVALPGRRIPMSDKTAPYSSNVRKAVGSYSSQLSRLLRGREQLRADLLRGVEVAVITSGNLFSSTSIGPVWSAYWNNPELREEIISAGARSGWVEARQTTVAALRRVQQKDPAALVRFMRGNLMKSGIPKSYQIPEGYWDSLGKDADASQEVDSIIERQITENSLLIYDGAVWQIALALAAPRESVEDIRALTRTLYDGKLGDFETIRAHSDPYRYGDLELKLPSTNAFFFRIIADKYVQPDPKDGRTRHESFPNQPLLHHEDWKPIMGEQAWAAILGPIQSGDILKKSGIRSTSEENELALSILPAMEAMMSPIGAVYHAPHGTHGKSGSEISTENNLSLLAALRVLQNRITESGGKPSARIQWLQNGVLNYFKKYAFVRQGSYFIQGGYYLEGTFIPANVFAADCQTWGIAALGPDWIDREFGEGTSREIWRTTRRRSGCFDRWGVLKGIGFTDQEDVVSVEWTAGAIIACKMMAQYYAASHPDWAKELEFDAAGMRVNLDEYRVASAEGGEAYLYANRRFFIPFGWWANPVPCIVSTAWVIMLDKDYNPFWPNGRYVPTN